MVPLSDYGHYVLSEQINNRGVRIDRRARGRPFGSPPRQSAVGRGHGESHGGHSAQMLGWQAGNVDRGARRGRRKVSARPTLTTCWNLTTCRAVRCAVRREAAKTSVSKIKAMLDPEGRPAMAVSTARVYHGAGTGRWTNMGVNYANMPGPRKSYGLRQDLVFEAIRTGDPDYLRFAYGPDVGRPLHPDLGRGARLHHGRAGL